VRVAVIGAGAMGKWLANFAKRNLGEVTVADIKSAKAKDVASEVGASAKPIKEAAARAELLLIAVPISKTPETVKSLAEIVPKDALLADVASVKSDVVDVMRKIKNNIELVSVHPLFGPGAVSIAGKDIVVVPVKHGKRYLELKKRLVELGARVTEMEAEQHDRLMAIIQCMTHFVLLAYLTAIKSMKELKLAKEIRTPMFAALTSLAKAVLAGNPELYGELQVHNRYAQIVRSSMIETCRMLDIAFSAGDAKSAEVIFKEALAPFGAGEAKQAYQELYKKFEGGIT
jgi:prephenate dehydrogenase